MNSFSSSPRLASLLPIVLFLVLAASLASKPLFLDSIDFVTAAESVARTGSPVTYRGEWNPSDSSLWHPPLYIYLLAAWFTLFGPGAAQGVAFGAVSALLHAAVVLALVRTLFGKPLRDTLEPWLLALFLLNPYTLQTSAILDIDSSIYGPILCLVLLAVLRLSWRDGSLRTDQPSRLDFALVSLAIAAALWSKLTTVLLVVPFAALLLIARFGLPRALRLALLLSAAGAALFLASYFAYGAVSGLDVRFTFDFLLFSLRERGSGGRSGLAGRLAASRENLAAMAPFMSQWTGLLPWLALPAATIAALRRRSTRFFHFAVLLALPLATTLYYCAQMQSYAAAPFKYTFVFWGLALLAPLSLAFPLDAPQPAFSRPLRSALALLALASFLYGFIRVGDRQLTEYRLWYGPQLLPAALLLAALLLPARWRRFSRPAACAALCAWAGFYSGIAIKQSQAPYSTNYDYGQQGITETALYLRAHTSQSDVISAMKDVSWLARRRFIENYAGLFAGPQTTARFIAELSSGRVKYVVFTEIYGQDRLFLNPALEKWVAAHCALEASFGNFRVFRVQPPRSAPAQ